MEIGGVLSQTDDTGQERVIAYASLALWQSQGTELQGENCWLFIVHATISSLSYRLENSYFMIVHCKGRRHVAMLKPCLGIQ